KGRDFKAAALIDLSTVADIEISNPPWVKFQSAGWVNFPSAPTAVRVPGVRHNVLVARCCQPLLRDAQRGSVE
ncbi:hypothetical protein QZM56_38210, partial [Burkholderia contaminans]